MRPTSIVLLIGSVLLPTATLAATLPIVENGKPTAVVVLSEKADAQTRQAAKLLVEYVRESTGAELPVVKGRVVQGRAGGENDLPTRIWVGETAKAEAVASALEGLSPDGFVIRGTEKGDIVIAGASAWGTEFGVCEFLERYVGVRWLMPGENGEDVPRRESLRVPVEEVRREPAFFSRQFSGLASSQQLEWARRNRMHGSIAFHHNLHRLFPPSKYGTTHPEFFPTRKGERYIPTNDNTHGWQPCFTAEGIVDEAVKNICEYFEKHPDVNSYSLGVIDSSGHCECEECLAMDPEEPNFLGRRNVSRRYFTFCNAVVERVLEKYPDKYFGCLAYSEVAQPPEGMNIHPRIVPFMTYDRMKWADPELRAEGHRLTEWWQRSSPTVGWYDYIYGTPYCVPRMWPHLMGEYYRYGYKHGVRAAYAEAYPNWGEGPKLWVSLRLQWDPNQDVDALLKEWYERAVGPEAAEDLAAYYAIWEDFWTRRVLDSAWFTKGGQYLTFSSPAYLADVTDVDVSKSRTLLDRVVAKAKTEPQKARAGLLRRAFAYYEASALAYPRGEAAAPAEITDEAGALRQIETVARKAGMAEKRRRLVEGEFAGDPVLKHPLGLDRYPMLQGNGWTGGGLWPLVEWIREHDGPAKTRLKALADSDQRTLRMQARAVLAIAGGRLEAINADPSFEDTSRAVSPAWSPWVKRGKGRIVSSPKAAHTGKNGLVFQGVQRGGASSVCARGTGETTRRRRIFEASAMPRKRRSACVLRSWPRTARICENGRRRSRRNRGRGDCWRSRRRCRRRSRGRWWIAFA